VSSKFYTNFIKAIMIILGITLLLLAIVYPWLILLAAAIFYFAYKYKAPDKTSKTNEIYHVKENAHTPGFTEYFLITDPKQLPSKLVFIDFETTGLSSLTDRIVEVGIATYENMELVDTYSQLIDPEINIDPKTSAVNGITYAMVKGKPKLKDVISEVYQRIEGQVIVGYNIDFDLSFLKYALSENNTELSDVRAFDVLRLVKETLRYKDTGDRKLESVKKYFGIESNGHRALDDCITTHEVFKRCLKLQENYRLQAEAKFNERLSNLNEMEKNFISELEKRLEAIGLKDKMVFDIKSDNTINFMLGNAQIGRVKLRGRKYKMQLLDQNNVMWLDIDSYDEAVTNLKQWVKYSQYLSS
jgi:DNA polymerase-3 subunit epsilon